MFVRLIKEMAQSWINSFYSRLRVFFLILFFDFIDRLYYYSSTVITSILRIKKWSEFQKFEQLILIWIQLYQQFTYILVQIFTLIINAVATHILIDISWAFDLVKKLKKNHFILIYLLLNWNQYSLINNSVCVVKIV